MRIPSGSTDRYLYFVAVDSTDLKTRETGLTTFTVYRSRNGAAAAAMTTPTVNETDTTNMPGVYELLLDEDTTLAAGNDTEEMCYHITQASMAPVTRVVEIYRPETTEGNTLGVESDGDATKVNTLDGHTAQTGDNFAEWTDHDAAIARLEANTGGANNGTLYVDDATGNDSNDGSSWALAKKTIAAANTAATAGDTIRIGPGTYVETFTVAVDGVTFDGAGKHATILENSATPFDCQNRQGTTVRNMKIQTTTDAVTFGIDADGSTETTVDNCYAFGNYDGIRMENTTRFRVVDSDIESNFDAIVASNAVDYLIERCTLFTDCTQSTVITGRAIIGGDTGVIRDSVLRVSNAVANGKDTTTIDPGHGMIVVNCMLVSEITHASATGDVNGVRSTTGDLITLQGCSVVTSNAGSGTVYDVQQVSTGILVIRNSHYDSTKTNGTITDQVADILTDTGTTLDDHLTDIKGTGFVKDTHSLIDIETYVDLIDDGTSGLTKIATDVAAILVDTGTTLDAKIDTIDTNVDAILVDTAEIGAAGAGLTAVPWNALWDAEVQSEVDDALTAFWTSPGTLVDLIWDEDIVTGHNAVDTAGYVLDGMVDWDDGGRLDLILDAILLDTGTTIPGTITTIDTVVDAIKAQTDLMQWTATNQLQADVQYVNAVQLQGAGTSGDLWRPV